MARHALIGIILVIVVVAPATAQDIFTTLSASRAIIQQLAQFDKAVEQILKTLPSDDQLKMLKIEDELKEYMLAAMTTSACDSKFLLDCYGLTSAMVNPAIQLTLDRRKAQAASADAQRTLYVAEAGMTISFASLFVSIVALKKIRRKGRKGHPFPPTPHSPTTDNETAAPPPAT